LEKVRIFFLIIIVLLLTGCSLLNPFKIFKMGTPNQEQKHSEQKTIKVTPKVFETSKGKFIVKEEVEYSYNSDWQQQDRQQGFFQKTWQNFLKLGIFGIILAVLAVFFPPVALILGFAGRATAKGTRTIVRALDRAMDKVPDPASKKVIYDTLSQEMDAKTKKMVANMKHEEI